MTHDPETVTLTGADAANLRAVADELGWTTERTVEILVHVAVTDVNEAARYRELTERDGRERLAPPLLRLLRSVGSVRRPIEPAAQFVLDTDLEDEARAAMRAQPIEGYRMIDVELAFRAAGLAVASRHWPIVNVADLDQPFVKFWDWAAQEAVRVRDERRAAGSALPDGQLSLLEPPGKLPSGQPSWVK